MYFNLHQFAITIQIRGIFEHHWHPRILCTVYNHSELLTLRAADSPWLVGKQTSNRPDTETAGRPWTLDLKQLEESSSWKHRIRLFKLKASISSERYNSSFGLVRGYSCNRTVYTQNLIKRYGASHQFKSQDLIWVQDPWYSLHESLESQKKIF